MENSNPDNDWCIISKSAASASEEAADDQQLATSKIENVTDDTLKNDSSEVKDIKASENDKANGCTEKEEQTECSENNPEKNQIDDNASDTNTESSSDVELIDDLEGIDQHERPNNNFGFNLMSLSLSMKRQPPLDLPEPDNTTTASDTVSPLPVNNLNQRREFFDYFFPFENNTRVLKLSFIVSLCFAIFIAQGIQIYRGYQSVYNENEPALTNLKSIHETLVKCLGEQQLQAHLDDNENLKHSPICSHNEEKYYPVFTKLLDYKLNVFLSDCLVLIEMNLTSDCKDLELKFFGEIPKKENFNLPIIIKQLQHLKLLPVSVLNKPTEKQPLSANESESLEFVRKMITTLISSNHKQSGSQPNYLNESETLEYMLKLIANLTSVNQALKKQVAEFDQSLKSDDLIIAKSTLPSSSTADTETMDIIDSLLSENERLQQEVMELRRSLKSHTSRSIDETIQTKIYAKPKSEKEPDDTQNFQENLKPYIDDLVSTLSGQILNLQTSFSNELRELKHYNELIRNMTIELYNSSTQTGTENWSWQEIKENMENVVSGVHEDLKERINNFQTLNFTDTLNKYVEDNKKNAEYMLNVINHYVGIVKEKTQEFLETPMPELDKKENIHGFWNLMNNLQDKWHYVKGTVKKIAKKFHHKKNHENVYDPKAQSDWYFERSKRDGINEYEGQEKVNWVVRRAAEREKRRKFNKEKKYD